MPKDNTIIVEIAIGPNRFASKWKNKKIPWQSLVEKLSTPHRTHETFIHYENAAKRDRDKIKDIGGFVGGYLTGGVRKSSSIAYRTVLTLDADEADKGFWNVFKLLYGHAAVLYSTHSHKPEKPRYRLVMPLNRHCSPEEYQPLARMVAGDLGIEQFDNTGFQDERLMYWPSCSIDGEFEFHHQEGPALDVDEMLSFYSNWRDISEWPVSERVTDLIKHSQKKQGDPLEKEGVVGAFCRAYGIEEVIEKYLSDVYEKTDKSDRYTYSGGTTAYGLIVYDNKFAFSHHNTDPISGKLCNSFDLVRLHLFEDEDKGIDKDTPINKRPSYTLMRELAAKDKEVRRQIGVEKLNAAQKDFKDLGIEGEENFDEDLNNDWLTKLQVSKQGDHLGTINNIVLILENDKHLKGCLSYDEFSYRAIINKKLPWKSGPDWQDSDSANLRWYLEKIYGINAASKTKDAVDVILQRNSRHPVRDYLNSLEWDGVERIETLLIDYFNAEDNSYVREATKKCLISAVARVFIPGCKSDYTLVLKGPQGYKKSMFIDILGGEWYSDTLTTVQGKEAYEQIQGCWIIEVAELAGMSKADIEHVKHFMSKRKDRFRAAYAHFGNTFLRQGIFIGTTNKDDFMKDMTGGRRFWPVVVRCKIKNEQELRNLRNQIWAEAVSLFKAGETWWFNDEIEKIAEAVQQAHTETDDRIEMIREYLDTPLPENWGNMNIWARREFLNGDPLAAEGRVERSVVTALDIYLELFGGAAKDYSMRTAREINDMMRRFEENWEYKIVNKKGSRFKGFVRRKSNYQKMMEKRFFG